MNAAEVRARLSGRWPDHRYLHVYEAPTDSSRQGSKIDVLVLSLWQSDLCRITRPGELTLELLAEAGLIERTALRKPLPPPPPGWTDPRPRIVPSRTGFTLASSEREGEQR